MVRLGLSRAGRTAGRGGPWVCTGPPAPLRARAPPPRQGARRGPADGGLCSLPAPALAPCRWYRAAGSAGGPQHPPQLQPHVVDLRSDTVTRPSMEMRQAMAQAVVGDDDYGEDPTVNELQCLAAQLLGMEEALFVPTSTMANLISGGWGPFPGAAGPARWHHGPQRAGVYNPCKLRQPVRLLADRYGLHVHMDGARLMNAAVAQGVSPARISQHCDSVSLCFSKGLGAPAGALVAGCKEFVAEAWCMRKLLGGGMRQAGVLAAAARVGLEHTEEVLQRDHGNARSFAQAVWQLDSPICSVDPLTVETNMVLVKVAVPWLSPEELCERLQAVSEEEVAVTGHAVSVRLFPWATRSLRAVWHCDISAQDTRLAASKLKLVAEQCRREHGAAS
ncbi:L-allo-threonine aldolase-like isoform X2 [Carettochelys insculpta]|uniref:L-allo-threonine aldolase-like isoform X2 n=1 Tax=Carettochelys insculpta TaxID=44489 RepID=UPI003EBDD9AC